MTINHKDFFVPTAPLNGVRVYVPDLDKYFEFINQQWVEVPRQGGKIEIDKVWIDELPEFLKKQAD